MSKTLLVAAIVALALLMSTCAAKAGEVTMTWLPPLKNCDGTNLTDLRGYRAYWSKNRVEIPDPAVLAFTATGLTPGDWWLNATAYNSKGEESYFAGPRLATIKPEEFVTTDTVAYTVVKRTDLFVLLPVGTVAKGVVCDPTQTVNGKYVVPRGSVTWTGTVKPDVVVATCG